MGTVPATVRRMHPRWRPDQTGSPLVNHPQGERSSSAVRQSFINEPLPDLEQQLAAQLEGVSWAVVSFVAEDAPWCDWIYRNLNGYPLPTTLVDRVTSYGYPRPDCLSIFPDRRDPDYEERYPRVLENSTYLIVVCSPEAARSRAVDDQIRAFKNAGGEERVLALVVDGPPDVQLGERRRAAQCDWLPAWLRWRLDAEGFRAADRNEPRVIDARRGYRSLKQVRDSLLSALSDADVRELERLGSCLRGVEIDVPAKPDSAEGEPVVTPAIAPATVVPVTRRGSAFTIVTAAMLVLIAVVFGTRSFLEITADEPVSTLEVAPITGVMPGRAAKTASREEPAAPVVQEAPAIVPEVAPAPVVAQSTPPVVEPPAVAPVNEQVEPTAKPAIPAVSAVPAAPMVQVQPPVTSSGITQIAPPPVDGPTSRIMSGNAPAESTSQPTAVLTARNSGSEDGSTNSTSGAESDAVLLDEVRTLERRGDETMAERRTEDALDLYHTALSSAQEYAARKGANPAARDQVIALMRKLGTLQMQNSSTAEARATYMQARKLLSQFKSQGQWTRERAKALDEIESRLLSLPRD